MKLRLVVLCGILVLGSVTAALAKEYTPPRMWKGAEVGDDKGNPAEGTNDSEWRFDRVWPDDPKLKKNYEPMVWSGKNWHATEHSHGGQPSGSIDKSGTVTLGFRGPWDDQPGKKISALMFEAPKSDKYEMKGTVSVRFFEGKGKAKFLVLVFDKKGKLEKVVKEIELGDGESFDLSEIDKFKVGKRDEVALVAMIDKFNCAGNVTISGLVMED